MNFRHICKVTDYLVSSDIAHNMAIMKGDSFSSPSEPALRAFVWFRQSTKGKDLEIILRICNVV